MPVLYLQGEKEKNLGIHYEVDMSLHPLGEGGMGQVRRGLRVIERNGLRQDVAIKFLFEDLPAHAIERARREASIQIHNENLVEMYGFIETIESSQVKHYHVVSELLEGVMLFDLLNGKVSDKSGRNIEYAEELYAKYQNNRIGFAVIVVKSILSGLMALHDKGYIHRDLDPSNIMITTDRKIKIIDYGIAKQIESLNTHDQQLTNSGQFVGKAAYAAPELVLGDVHSQDRTTDIYAVGIMLYQFIVGRLPFEGTMAELIGHQLHSKLPLKNITDKSLRNIIKKATAKKQSDRYQSAAEMRVGMEHLASDRLIPATGNGSHTLFSSVNHKKVIPAVVIVVATMTLGGGLAAYVTHRGPSQEEIEKAYHDSIYNARDGMVIDDNGTTEVIDEESGAKMLPVGMLVSEAFKNLEDSTTIQNGVAILQKIATKYGEYRHSAEAVAVLAAITQPLDASICSERIRSVRASSANFMTRDAAKAHQYALRAVESDTECYQAIYELATDFLFGEPRTGESDSRDENRAEKLYNEGLGIARRHNDEEYISMFEKRIEQINLSKSE